MKQPKFTDRQKTVVNMTKKGYTFEEICKRLGVAESTLYGTLRRIKKHVPIQSVTINADRTITIHWNRKQLKLPMER